jgi:hypothetical protein
VSAWHTGELPARSAKAMSQHYASRFRRFLEQTRLQRSGGRTEVRRGSQGYNNPSPGAATLAITEESYLMDCWERGVCPHCGKTFPAHQRVGSGSKADGGSCSVSCYGKYHMLSLAERHQRRLQQAVTQWK